MTYIVLQVLDFIQAFQRMGKFLNLKEKKILYSSFNVFLQNLNFKF